MSSQSSAEEKQETLRITYKSGEVLFAEGDDADFALLIESGEVAITRRGRLGDVLLGTCGRGDVVGEMALIDDNVRSATVTALEDSTVAVIRRHQILNRLDNCDPVIAQLVKTMMKRFRGTEKVLLSQGDDVQQKLGLTAPERDPVSKLQIYGDLLREREVEEAINKGQIEAFFQPIVHVDDVRPAAFEALVRWRHPQRGIMNPGVFIPLAEKSGFIVPIDRHVMVLAARFIKRANDLRAGQPLIVSLNLSSHEFRDFGVVASIEAAIRDAGIDPHWLQVEVTESALIEDRAMAKEIIGTLRDMGVKTALDDFGTGYSSMSYLTDLPIEFLKVDRSFVRDVHQGEVSRKVVRSIVGLAKSMSLLTVAEGIETAGQEATLREIGCDLGQGYLYGHPLPADEAIAWLDHDGQERNRIGTSSAG